jgi:transcriptional regulator with XRE-family HTH domain
VNEPKPWLAGPGGIAERLRELQHASQLSGRDLADRLGWLPSKVSRVRNGIVAPSDADVTAWARVTGDEAQIDDLIALVAEARTHRGDYFRDRMAAGQAPVQIDYNRLVQESQVIRHFETAWIPGLLQTRDYARRVFEEMVRLHGAGDDIDAALTERLKRQQYLHDQEKRFEFLVAEPALHWGSMPAATMRTQLGVLLTWLDAPNLRLGVLPMRAALPWTPQNAFQVYDELVIVEDFAGEVEREPDIYLRVLADLWASAAEGDQVRELVEASIERWAR